MAAYYRGKIPRARWTYPVILRFDSLDKSGLLLGVLLSAGNSKVPPALLSAMFDSTLSSGISGIWVCKADLIERSQIQHSIRLGEKSWYDDDQY